MVAFEQRNTCHADEDFGTLFLQNFSGKMILNSFSETNIILGSSAFSYIITFLGIFQKVPLFIGWESKQSSGCAIVIVTNILL